MLVEENWTVIPAGSEPVESAMEDVNPLAAVMVIVVAEEAPAAMVTLDGAAASVNVALDVSTSGRIIVLVKLPLVPLIAIEYLPATAELLAATVTVLVPDPGDEIVDGANPTVTPAGNALPFDKEAVRATAPLKPPALVLVNVMGALDPCGTVTVSMFLVNRNGGAIASDTLAADVTPPPIAVTVIVAS